MCSFAVILYIEDVDLNADGTEYADVIGVILYIEDVDLNGRDPVQRAGKKVILYIEDVDLNTSQQNTIKAIKRHPLH